MFSLLVVVCWLFNCIKVDFCLFCKLLLSLVGLLAGCWFCTLFALPTGICFVGWGVVG